MIDLTTVFFDTIIRTNADAYSAQDRAHMKNRECGDLEMDALECVEAYGMRRGRQVCMKYVEDFRECLHQTIQDTRVAIMRRERIKQVLRGERKFSEILDDIKPSRDGYQQGPFYN